MPYREQLIRLYAEHPASDVKSLAAYEALQAEHDGDDFRGVRHEIEKIKTSIEVRFAGAQTEQDQLKAAIRALRQTRFDAHKSQLCYELIVAGFARHWEQVRQDYLLRVLNAVRLKRDYFMSYTTRYLARGAINPVNHEYRHFISDILGRPLKDTNQRANLLARAIDEIFTRKAKGFLFESSQYDNTITEEKLEQELADSMVFVQLVQLVMFQPDEDQRPNYCYWEWRRAKARFGDQRGHLLYLVAEPSRDELKQTAPYIDYTDWHEDVVTRDPPYIPRHRTLNKASIEETTQMLERFCDQHITGAWIRLEQAAP